jgi:hypothetical protein
LVTATSVHFEADQSKPIKIYGWVFQKQNVLCSLKAICSDINLLCLDGSSPSAGWNLEEKYVNIKCNVSFNLNGACRQFRMDKSRTLSEECIIDGTFNSTCGK